MSKWLDSDGNINSDLFVESSFPDDTVVYDTPDWVRHPERYPELMKRMRDGAEMIFAPQETGDSE